MDGRRSGGRRRTCRRPAAGGYPRPRHHDVPEARPRRVGVADHTRSGGCGTSAPRLGDQCPTNGTSGWPAGPPAVRAGVPGRGPPTRRWARSGAKLMRPRRRPLAGRRTPGPRRPTQAASTWAARNRFGNPDWWAGAARWVAGLKIARGGGDQRSPPQLGRRTAGPRSAASGAWSRRTGQPEPRIQSSTRILAMAIRPSLRRTGSVHAGVRPGSSTRPTSNVISAGQQAWRRCD